MTTAFGYATPMGLGLALALPKRRVVVIDTDGGVLFTMGALTTLGNLGPPNLKVFVMDNECYESIGAMPSATSGRADLAGIAKAAGIEQACTSRTLAEFKKAAKSALANDGLCFVVVKVEIGTKKLPRHRTADHIETKYRFVRYVEDTEKIDILASSL